MELQVSKQNYQVIDLLLVKTKLKKVKEKLK